MSEKHLLGYTNGLSRGYFVMKKEFSERLRSILEDQPYSGSRSDELILKDVTIFCKEIFEHTHEIEEPTDETD